ncbi:hypothetical protein U1Q18_027063 [Sarracenia purpurea var. burkii]
MTLFKMPNLTPPRMGPSKTPRGIMTLFKMPNLTPPRMGPIVCSHGACRVSEDLLLDGQESVDSGLLSFLGGVAASPARMKTLCDFITSVLTRFYVICEGKVILILIATDETLPFPLEKRKPGFNGSDDGSLLESTFPRSRSTFPSDFGDEEGDRQDCRSGHMMRYIDVIVEVSFQGPVMVRMPADLPLICVDAQQLPIYVDVRPTELWNRYRSTRGGIFQAGGCSGQHSSAVLSWWLLFTRLYCSPQLYRASDIGQLWLALGSQVGCCSVDVPRLPGRARLVAGSGSVGLISLYLDQRESGPRAWFLYSLIDGSEVPRSVTCSVDLGFLDMWLSTSTFES